MCGRARPRGDIARAAPRHAWRWRRLGIVWPRASEGRLGARGARARTALAAPEHCVWARPRGTWRAVPGHARRWRRLGIRRARASRRGDLACAAPGHARRWRRQGIMWARAPHGGFSARGAKARVALAAPGHCAAARVPGGLSARGARARTALAAPGHCVGARVPGGLSARGARARVALAALGHCVGTRVPGGT